MARRTKAQLLEEKRRKQVDDDLAAVMATPVGRRFIWRQLGAAGVFHECYNAESEGARRVGLALYRDILRVCPGQYLVMQNEAISAETLARIQKEQAKGEDHEQQ